MENAHTYVELFDSYNAINDAGLQRYLSIFNWVIEFGANCYSERYEIQKREATQAIMIIERILAMRAARVAKAK